MIITRTAFVVVPILLAVMLLRPSAIIRLVVLTSVCTSMAVVFMPAISFGLQPGAVVLLAWGLYLAAKTLGHGRVELPTPLQRDVLGPFALFVAWAGLTALVMPGLLQGVVEVQNAEGTWQPLAPSRLNLTQWIYLATGLGIVILLATEIRTQRALARVMRSVIATGWVVLAFGLYQVGASYAGLPRLERWLYTNVAFKQHYGQMLFGKVARLSSVLVEPSFAAHFFTGYLTTIVVLLLVRSSVVSRRTLMASAAVGWFGLALTATTTAFVATGVGAVAIFCYCIARARTVGWAFATTVPICALLVVIVSLPASGGSERDQALIVRVARALTTEKLDGQSGETRLQQERDGAVAFPRSLGLGFGWGSYRTVTLAGTILLGSGLPGMVLLAIFGRRIVRGIRRSRAGETKSMVLALFVGVAMMTLVAIVAIPDLIFLYLWVWIGLGVAGLGVLEREARDRRRMLKAPLGVTHSHMPA